MYYNATKKRCFFKQFLIKKDSFISQRDDYMDLYFLEGIEIKV